MDSTSGLSASSVGFASRLGSFEAEVIKEILAAGQEAYGAELRRRLTSRLGREITDGQISRTLTSLRRLGLAQRYRFDPPREKHQRHRLVHALTPTGVEVTEAIDRRQEPRGPKKGL